MPSSFSVKILDRQWLSKEIMALSCEKPFDFKAGQYCFIEHEGQRHPFSIASAPFEHHLCFHLQHSERRPMQPALWQLIQHGQTLNLSQAEGHAYLREDSARPLLFIAGGSGFAPIHSIIKQLLHNQSTRPLRLYWGVQNISFIYDLKSLDLWQSQFADFQFTLVLEKDSSATARHGLVHQAVLKDQLPLHDFDIYIAGPFVLSQVAQSEFIQHFGTELKIYSDALTQSL
jgi:NAD(P)H-flavin reductase